ncbi:DEAD/DEAH box helicase, partial [Candidatus Woesearchaeota archaeon]|nr:DEAD/DEAH box helicase [Candidatus Woesearchaeota archaeon]
KYRRTFTVEVYGGVSIGPQIDHLRSADVVVGTPGRMLDHLSRGTLNLSRVHILVLDEADKMFEMGFIQDVKKILSKISPKAQKLLFSATMSTEIMNIVKQFMNNPERVKMPSYVDKSKLIQHYYDTERNNKFSLLVHTLKTEAKGLVLVFCGTRHGVDLVHKNLYKQHIRSQAIHGGISQHQRKQVMDAFREGKLDVLVASDVAARGLDIKNVNLIINYDLPKTSLDYVHRIGRTARAGCEGKVISLLTQEDHDNFRSILQDRSLLIHKMSTPHCEHVEFIRPPRSPRPTFRRFQGRRRF